MSNTAPTSNPEGQKRRSSRIVQAVPVAVTGVDALGRPFQERTSTVIINCHGCRYQSKHYVLKNMWVTLSVPHPEPDHEPRSARARVMWIRRPHTVRELFQVGVELETPGNLWGIAFPEPDWFPFPQTQPEPERSLTVSEIPLEGLPEMSAAGSSPEAREDNLRTMPPAGTAESSLFLARQMARLVNEAKQQLQAAVRDSAAQAVSAETRPLLTALQRQLQEVARQSVEAVAEQAVQDTVVKTIQASEAQLAQVREFWNRQLAESIEQAHRSSSARLEETMQQLRGSFLQDLQNESRQAIHNLDQATRDFQEKLSQAQENLTRVSQGAENAAAPFVEEIEQRLRAQSDEVRARLDELQNASQQWRAAMDSAAGDAQAAWQGRLETHIHDAESRWHEQFENSVENAVQQAAQRLSSRSQETAEQMEREAGLRIATMGRALLEAASEAEQKMGTLGASFDAQASQMQSLLAQVQAASSEVGERTEQLHALEHTVLAEMDSRGNVLMEAQAQKLDQRTEAALADWTARFEPTLESAGRQVVARLGSELEQQFGAQLAKVGPALSELQNQTQAAQQAAHQHVDSVRALSEQEVESALERMGGSIGQLEHNLQESCRNAAAKWIGEIDAKATETTHTTFESLFKTAEWYEKKVQTQMHNTLEKGLEQAGELLRDKAGELSRVFAAEMDHFSRSYVEHAHNQIAEAGRESLGSMQKQAADLADGATRTIAQQTQNHTDSALGQFRTQAEGVLGQISSQVDTLAGQARAKFDADTQQSQAQFRAALTQNVREALRACRQEIGKELESAKESLRAEGQRETSELRQTMGALHDQAVESYRRRLESASDAWLLTTVTKLNQHSAQHLETLARTAQARLRETCTQVFSSVGDSLRRRLLDVALQPLADEPALPPTTEPRPTDLAATLPPGWERPGWERPASEAPASEPDPAAR